MEGPGLEEMNGGGEGLNYRVCTTKSPERRRGKRRRRREKALPLSAELSVAGKEEKKKKKAFKLQLGFVCKGTFLKKLK